MEFLLAYKGLVDIYHITRMDFGRARTLYNRLVKQLHMEQEEMAKAIAEANRR